MSGCTGQASWTSRRLGGPGDWPCPHFGYTRHPKSRTYLAWLNQADSDGDPLRDARARDGAVRDFRTHLQTVPGASPPPSTRLWLQSATSTPAPGLGPPDVPRLGLPPRALADKDAIRWLRAVERRLNPTTASCPDPVLRRPAHRRDRRPEHHRGDPWLLPPDARWSRSRHLVRRCPPSRAQPTTERCDCTTATWHRGCSAASRQTLDPQRHAPTVQGPAPDRR
jgi:hypothetical protein